MSQTSQAWNGLSWIWAKEVQKAFRSCLTSFFLFHTPPQGLGLRADQPKLAKNCSMAHELHQPWPFVWCPPEPKVRTEPPLWEGSQQSPRKSRNADPPPSFPGKRDLPVTAASDHSFVSSFTYCEVKEITSLIIRCFSNKKCHLNKVTCPSSYSGTLHSDVLLRSSKRQRCTIFSSHQTSLSPKTPGAQSQFLSQSLTGGCPEWDPRGMEMREVWKWKKNKQSGRITGGTVVQHCPETAVKGCCIWEGNNLFFMCVVG